MTMERSSSAWPRKTGATAVAAALVVASVPMPSALAQTASAARFRGEPVTLNFVNADIEGVARAISSILRQQFIVDPRVRGNITLYSEEPLTPREAYFNFLAALRGLGFTVVEVNGLYKVVPEADAKLQTGTVDGLENPLPDAMAAKFYEVSKQVVLTGHMVANVFFSLAGGFWNGLPPAQQKAIAGAVAASKKMNDDGVIETEKTAAAFFEGKGVKVTTPDVGAFRTQVQKRFLESKFAKTWPPGLLDRINKAGA